MTDVPLDPIAIDVGSLVKKTVTSLYSHLVTRPTGRAVRMAIETQLLGAGSRSLSLIDLSEVTILDFSCADEVVAKLLQRYLEVDAQEAFFVFCGVHEPHRDQIQVVLERQGLVAVAETDTAVFELLGAPDDLEQRAWLRLEERGLIGKDDVESLFPEDEQRAALNRLVDRRVAFRSPISGRYHALSRLVRHLL
ncbi:MAG: hypothetical protein O2992_05610 [Gemmatimonadetes bacterium]|jgi:anti-anti-sigma regulatory factor|nr:hypothetical protein [Gemmatimonadota bacterium]